MSQLVHVQPQEVDNTWLDIYTLLSEVYSTKHSLKPLGLMTPTTWSTDPTKVLTTQEIGLTISSLKVDDQSSYVIEPLLEPSKGNYHLIIEVTKLPPINSININRT